MLDDAIAQEFGDQGQGVTNSENPPANSAGSGRTPYDSQFQQGDKPAESVSGPVDPAVVNRQLDEYLTGKKPLTQEAFAKHAKISLEDAGKALQRAHLAGRITPAKNGGYRRPPTRVAPLDVLDYLASNGGVSDPTGELRSMDLHKAMTQYGNVVRKTGMHPDKAREALVEAGYMRDSGRDTGGQATTTVADFFDVMSRAASGEKIYIQDDEAKADEIRVTKANQDLKPVDWEDLHPIELRYGPDVWSKVQAVLEEMGTDEFQWSAQEINDAARMIADGMNPDDAFQRTADMHVDDLRDDEDLAPEITAAFQNSRANAMLAFAPTPPAFDLELDNVAQQQGQPEASDGVRPAGEAGQEPAGEAEVSGAGGEVRGAGTAGDEEGSAGTDAGQDAEGQSDEIERPRRNAINSNALEDALSPKAQAALAAYFKRRNASRDLRHIREAMEIYQRALDGGLEAEAEAVRQAAETFFLDQTQDNAGDLDAAAYEGLQAITGEEDPDPAELLENEVFASAEDAGELIFQTLDPKTASFDVEEFNTAYGDVELRRPQENVFPPVDEIKRIWKEVGLNRIEQEEADARIQSWKDYAKLVGQEEDHSKEVIFSLFDTTGKWSQPYRDAGYTVIQYDIQNGNDLMKFGEWMSDVENEINEDREVVGILAAPPCTTYAVSGNRWRAEIHNKADREMIIKTFGDVWAADFFKTPTDYANALVAVVKLIVEQADPKFYAMENPIGTIAKHNHLPQAQLAFDPANFGNPYTKRTLLWGEFNTDLPTANVDPYLGSLMHKLRGTNPKQKKQRSDTPEGFAYAFFMANNTSDIPFNGKKAKIGDHVDERMQEKYPAGPALLRKKPIDYNNIPNPVNNKPVNTDAKPDERLILMACGAEKAKIAAGEKVKPIELYTGAMYQVLNKWMPNLDKGKVVILSAKHGILPGTGDMAEFHKIETYDERMTPKKAQHLVEAGIYGQWDDFGRFKRGTAKGASAEPLLRPDGRNKYQDVFIAGGGEYRKVFHAYVTQMIEEGIISPDASINEVTGGIGEQRGQLGEYLRTIAGATPAKEEPSDITLDQLEPQDQVKITLREPIEAKGETFGPVIEGEYMTQAGMHFIAVKGKGLLPTSLGPIEPADVVSIERTKDRAKVFEDRYNAARGEAFSTPLTRTRDGYETWLRKIASAIAGNNNALRRSQLVQQMDDVADEIGLAKKKRKWLIAEAEYRKRGGALEYPSRNDLTGNSAMDALNLQRPKSSDFEPSEDSRKVRLEETDAAAPKQVVKRLQKEGFGAMSAASNPDGDPENSQILVTMPGGKENGRAILTAKRGAQGWRYTVEPYGSSSAAQSQRDRKMRSSPAWEKLTDIIRELHRDEAETKPKAAAKPAPKQGEVSTWKISDDPIRDKLVEEGLFLDPDRPSSFALPEEPSQSRLFKFALTYHPVKGGGYASVLDKRLLDRPGVKAWIAAHPDVEVKVEADDESNSWWHHVVDLANQKNSKELFDTREFVQRPEMVARAVEINLHGNALTIPTAESILKKFGFNPPSDKRLEYILKSKARASKLEKHYAINFDFDWKNPNDNLSENEKAQATIYGIRKGWLDNKRNLTVTKSGLEVIGSERKEQAQGTIENDFFIPYLPGTLLTDWEMVPGGIPTKEEGFPAVSKRIKEGDIVTMGGARFRADYITDNLYRDTTPSAWIGFEKEKNGKFNPDRNGGHHRQIFYRDGQLIAHSPKTGETRDDFGGTIFEYVTVEKSEAGADSKQQLVIPGAEQDVKGAMQNAANKPMRAATFQKPMDIGMFGSEKDQTDMFDAPKPKDTTDYTEEAKAILSDVEKIDTKQAKNFAVGMRARLFNLKLKIEADGLAFYKQRLAELQAEAANTGENVEKPAEGRTLESAIFDNPAEVKLIRSVLDGGLPATPALKAADRAYTRLAAWINDKGYKVANINSAVEDYSIRKARGMLDGIAGASMRLAKAQEAISKGYDRANEAKLNDAISQVNELAREAEAFVGTDETSIDDALEAAMEQELGSKTPYSPDGDLGRPWRDPFRKITGNERISKWDMKDGKFKTPGTNLTWTTLAHWIKAAWDIDERPPSKNRHQNRTDHLNALADNAEVIRQETDSSVVDAAIKALHGAFQTPPRGQRAGTPYERLNQLLTDRLAQLKRKADLDTIPEGPNAAVMRGDSAATQAFDPAQHIKLVADDIEAVRKQDVERLFAEAPQTADAFDDLRIYLISERPDLVGKVWDAIDAVGMPERETPQLSAETKAEWKAAAQRLYDHVAAGNKVSIPLGNRTLTISRAEQLKVGNDGLYVQSGKKWDYITNQTVEAALQQVPSVAPAPKGLQGNWWEPLMGGEEKPKQPKTASEAAASAVKNTAMSLEEAAKGLQALFGNKNKLNSGFTFDEDDYAKAKPFFKASASHLKEAAKNMQELAIALVRALKGAGMTADAIEAMKPYLKRFMQDIRDGKETLDAPGSSEVLEPDSGDAAAGDSVGAADVPAAADGNGLGAADGGVPVGETVRRPGRGGRVPRIDAPVVGENGNLELPAREPGAAGGNAPAGEPVGSPASGGDGLPDDRIAPEKAAATVGKEADLATRIQQQKAAEKLPSKDRDLQNIRATLPVLTKEQQEDVLKVEERFAKPAGHGMLLTNGTGTGKTLSGLGVVKRFARQGKGNILIVAPSQSILNQWVDAARWMGLDVSILESTQDKGKGIVATTYANLGENATLGDRAWDLIVTDESHKLSSDKDGTPTSALQALRAITLHPDGMYRRGQMIFRKEWEAYERLKPTGKNPSAAQVRAADEAYSEWRAKYDAAKPAWEKEPRSKVLMLSATPFAYHFSLDYAAEYLYELPKDDNGGGYNSAGGREQFYITNFGYRMRTGKLTKPEADVNSDVMERQFHEKMKKDGALAGRALEVDKDYERRFLIAESLIGEQIDKAMEFLSRGENGRFTPLYDLAHKKFDYLSKMRLLEAMKAESVIPYMKKSLALGRKIVVFHDYNEGGGISPFIMKFSPDQEFEYQVLGKRVKVNAQELYNEFLAKAPYVKNLDFESYQSPINAITREFPTALIFNGTVPNKKREEAKRLFNTDNNGADIIVVQAAAGEAGISLHDTTGKHQRVLINLGLPVRPTTALQEEGRIYRVGQKSDAIFVYLNTGTTFERWTFALKTAERSSTAENLAMGDQARTIKMSFVDAFNDASEFDPQKGDGKGGKERDRPAINGISEFERAKTHYFANQKIRGRRDQREGIDYFPTPEPLGLKMVEWANVKPGEKILEPSAGHGAIARYFPETTSRTLVEPSEELASRASIVSTGARVVVSRFEDFDIVNKYDAIVMNPPFGNGASTAMSHIEKATKHLKNGGRIVALIPRGSAADNRLERFMESDAAKNIYMVADIQLPVITFERAGTAVRAHVIILEKQTDKENVTQLREIGRDYTDADTINDFFNKIENTEAPDRIEPKVKEVEIPTEGEVTIDGLTFNLKGNPPGNVYADLKTYDRARFGKVARTAEKHGGYWLRSIKAFTFTGIKERAAFLEDLANPPQPEAAPAAPATAAPGAAAPAPISAKFRTAEFNHSKNGKRIFAATAVDRTSPEDYQRILAVAKRHGGYYSSFRGAGAVPGFHFPSEDARIQFLADMQGPKQEPLSSVPLNRGAKFDAMNARVRSRRDSVQQEVEADIERHGVFSAKDGNRSITVTPSLYEPGMLQVTYFTDDEATGHFNVRPENIGSELLSFGSYRRQSPLLKVKPNREPKSPFLPKPLLNRQNPYQFIITERQAAAMTVAVNNAADRILGRKLGIGLKISDRMPRGENPHYNPDEDFIHVALSAHTDTRITLRHEAIHALRQAGVFSPHEWAILSREAKKVWIWQYDIRRRYEARYRKRMTVTPEQLEELMIEEAVADAFSEHWLKDPSEHVIARIFQRIKEFLIAVGNAARGLGYKTTESIFDAAEGGEMSQRQRGSGQDRGFKVYARNESVPYGNAPDSLMGFRKSGNNKGFNEGNYPYVADISMDFADGPHVEAIRGLNKAHILERAKRNWPSADNHRVVGEVRKYEGQAALDNVPADDGGRVGGMFGGPTTAEEDRLLEEFAGNINLNRIDGPESLKDVLRNASDQADGFIGARRGVVSHNETRMLAEQMGLTVRQLLSRRKGQAFNAHEAFAARAMLVKSADLVKQAAARVQRTRSDVDRAYFMRMMTRHAAIQEQVAGMTAEAGRALNQFRMMAGADYLRSVTEALNERSINGRIGNNGVDDLAGMVDEMDQPGQVETMARSLYRPRFLDMVREFYINSLLSGPATQTVNLISNLLTAVNQIPEQFLAEQIGKFHDGEKVERGEAIARAVGLLEGSREGIKLAGMTLWTGEQHTSETQFDQRVSKAIPGIGGEVVRLPSRLMMASDDFFKAINYRAEINALAVRMATSEGLTGQQLAQRIQDLTSDPTDAMMAKAHEAARYQTFQNKLGDKGQILMRFREAWHLWPILPFLRTPINILKYATERTPLGPLLMKDARERVMGKKGRAQQDIQISRMVLGTVVMTGMAAMVLSGMATGGGPDDDDEKGVKRATGWQPYSLQIGNTFYSYLRFDPFALHLGVVADMVELRSKFTDGNYQKAASTLVASIIKNITEKTWVKSALKFTEMLQDPISYVERTAGDFASGFVPNFSAQIARTNDPSFRDARGFVDKLKDRIPGLRETLPQRFDIFGNPIKGEGNFGPDIISPVWLSTQKDNPIAQALLDAGYFPGQPRRHINGHDLTPEQYAEYTEMAGKEAVRRLDRLVQAETWSKRSQNQRESVLKQGFDKAREVARAKLMNKYPELRKKAPATP